MSRSLRVFYRGMHGRVRVNHNWTPITARSAVVVTAAEWAPREGSLFGLENERPLLGEATIWVSNVGVHGPEGGDGGVEFHLHVDWPSPLAVMVTITVLDEIEQFVTA